MDKGGFIVKNVAEDLVDMYLEGCIRSSGMCQCARCYADVRAIALNKFPPRYVVTDLGEALALSNVLSNQFEADIITAITSAIVAVKASPRH